MLTLKYIRKVIFYRTENGKCPVEDLLDLLPGKVVQKIVCVLKLLEDLEVVPVNYFSKMSGTDDIWECRIKQGSNIYRIFAFWKGNEIILTHGFIKKTQKTPRNEIEKAENYKKDYLNRIGRQSHERS